MTEPWRGPTNKIDRYRWEIPSSYKHGMRVSGIVYADEKMMAAIRADQALEQVANVAFLPGIVGHSLAMPDIHWGYGFPVGGVAATRVDEGVVSPGGIGFDINCGVRLLRTSLRADEVRAASDRLAADLLRNIPSGVGSTGKIRLTEREVDDVLSRGALWAVEQGYGEAGDLDRTEERGCMAGADPHQVSDKAKRRGLAQLGTLGSGNHFLEIQEVEEIYDRQVARIFGIEEEGQAMVFIHTGSRGLGYQVCEDYLQVMGQASRRYGIELPDRQLACAPVRSPEGKAYLAAMACATNYAWANRQCITHWVRESFARFFGKDYAELGMKLVYDVGHNIAKIEEHRVDGKKLRLCVHRKGATRAFPGGHPEVPAEYSAVGHPVLIPGDMGRCSYVAVGTPRAMDETFGSTCHGAGRVQSRTAAKRGLRSEDLVKSLRSQGITVRAANAGTLAEEAPQAYKDVSEVVDVVDGAGISRKVARLRPVVVIKG